MINVKIFVLIIIFSHCEFIICNIWQARWDNFYLLSLSVKVEEHQNNSNKSELEVTMDIIIQIKRSKIKMLGQRVV